MYVVVVSVEAILIWRDTNEICLPRLYSLNTAQRSEHLIAVTVRIETVQRTELSLLLLVWLHFPSASSAFAS